MEIDILQSMWPFEKMIACLNRIAHPELIPKFSEQEHNVISKSILGDNAQMLDLLKIFYKKSNGKLEIYGTPEEMEENFVKLDKVPELVKFFVNDKFKVPILCAMLSPITTYYNSTRKFCYLSKRDNFMNTYKQWISFVEPVPMDQIVNSFYKSWFILLAEKILSDLEGSYDLIPEDSYNIVLSDLKNSYKSESRITCPSGVVTLNWFLNLKKHFDQDEVQHGEEKVWDVLMKTLKNAPIASNQEEYKKIYAEISFLIEKAQDVFKRHADLFTPFSKQMTPSIHQKPVIRHLNGRAFEYFLAKELEVSMKLAVKDCPGRAKLLKDLIIVENEEERKKGIVYAVQISVFNRMLKELDMSWENLVILDVPLDQDYLNMSLPIISSYGTHCVPCLDAFDRINYYLTVILKVFQRSNDENLQKVFQWIDTIMDSLFVRKPVFYLVEIWKIEEIIEKARKELPCLLTKPEYEVPFKPEYTKNEVFGEFEKLLANLRWEKRHFVVTVNSVLNLMARETITIKNVYSGYCQMIRLYLQAYRPKVTSFVRSQSCYVKLNINDILPSAKSEPENETFTGFKKGFLNKSTASSKKQEPKEQEKMPSCSTENAENEKSDESNEIQQLRGELEKLTDYKNRLQDKFKTEKERLKIVTESSEKEIQQLREKLEKSQKSKTHLEEDLKSQITTITVGFEEQIQKAKEELEKSREMNAHLEVTMKVIEDNHREEIERLKEDQKKTEDSEKEIQLLREELEKCQKSKAEAENDLKSQIQTITIGFEEQVQSIQKTLEKSQNAYTNLEGDLKTLILNHLDEVRNLNRDAEKEKKKLERENADLEYKSKNLEKELDDSKQKNEFLLSENGKLRADNFKNTEFQQKIKEHSKVLKDEHCGLVDNSWSRLHSSENPDVESAKIDVRKMEDCVDEFFGNVKKDLKKL